MGLWMTPVLFIASFVSFTVCQDNFGPEISAINGDDMYGLTEEEKRSGLKAVPFTCNGYDNVPRCLHGGKGPRKTQTRSGNFCVCLCPQKWLGPECNVPSGENTIGKREDDEDGKRAWNNLNSLQLGKRLTLPWGLKQMKRNLPWALKAFPVRRNAVDDLEEEEKRMLPWALKAVPAMPDKKALPWALKAVPGKKDFPWAMKTFDGKGKRGWSFSGVPLGKRDTEDADTE